MKTVGSRHKGQESPAQFVRRAERIIAEADRLAPLSKPRGFVVKSKTWQDYTAWRRAQSNPRLW